MQEGYRFLRESVSISGKNPKVLGALDSFRAYQNKNPLKDLCTQFVTRNDIEAGKSAVAYLTKSINDIPNKDAEYCLETIVDSKRMNDNEVADKIVSNLLQQSSGARDLLAEAIQNNPALSFEKYYSLGDSTAISIAAVVLNTTVWPTKDIQETAKADVFQLLLAKLLEVGHEYEGKALKGITRLIVVDAENLEQYLDDSAFDAVLCCFNIALPMEIRSYTTVITAKFLETSHERGQDLFSKYIMSRIARHTNNDLVQAFSAAAGVFPLAPSTASSLFLVDGFVPSLVPLLEKRSKSVKVEEAALYMLSAACIDGGCRDAISKHCMHWLQYVVEKGRDDLPGLAALVLTKLHGSNGTTNGKKNTKSQENGTPIDDLVPMMKTLMTKNETISQQNSTEGLVYASTHPAVKEKLAGDKDFLQNLVHTLRTSPPSSPTLYGGLKLIENLTRYLPILSEEQKRMSQLNAYANASKPSAGHDPLDEDAAVTRRCKAVLDAGVLSALSTIVKNFSSTSLTTAFNILQSISKTPSHRATMAQQGAIKLLLLPYSPDKVQPKSQHVAAHALARILISVDPQHVFPPSGIPSMTTAVSVLLPLINKSTLEEGEDTSGPRNLLPMFEALLALTNLASTPSSEAAELIIHRAVSDLEELLLSNNTLLQRASTELMCNLMAYPSGIALFAAESKEAGRRLHIILALADVDDTSTRRAAGGALATVTGFEEGVKGILNRDRGVEILLGLCADEEEGIVHRGVVCVGNLVGFDGEVGRKAKEKVKELDGALTLKNIMTESTNRVISEGALMALKLLME